MGGPVYVAAGAGEEQSTKREELLWRQTDGLFDPWRTAAHRREAPGGHEGRVSIVTPTVGSRQKFHQHLWTCFNAQTWPDKELVVVETYDTEPSAFFEKCAKEDRRVTYVKFQREPGQDWSIGLKRNIGSHLASGEFIAQFDDDDLYAPRYISTLVEEMQSKGSKGITLSSWYIFDTETGTFGYCDPLRWGSMNGLGLECVSGDLREQVDKRMYGYGFSYVYRRSAALEFPFSDVTLGEDLKFFSQLRDCYGKDCIALLADRDGISLHTQHGCNTSSSVALWEVPREEVADLDIADYYAFSAYMFIFPKRDEQRSRHIEDWTGKGEQLKMPPRRRFRVLRLHTSFGEEEIRCTKGVVAKDFLRAAEERLGALSPLARLWREPPEARAPDAAPLGEGDRVGGYTEALWLELPEDRPPSGGAQHLWPHAGGEGEAGACGSRTQPHVRVLCPSTISEESVSRVFHVALPPEATVADLRKVLGSALPAEGQVFSAMEGQGRGKLRDGDAVPERVALSCYTGVVTLKMIVTREQGRQAQEILKQMMLRPDIQHKLDEMVLKAGGNQAKYRVLLKHLLNWEVYPPICDFFGLPNDGKGPFLLWQGIGAHLPEDLEMHEAWLELEMIMRNEEMARRAYAIVWEMRRQRGLPMETPG